jgi:ribosomal protein L37AE/L43A
MESIDKKTLKKMACPSCGRPKLRFEHSVDGIAPDGGTGPERDIRCDACRTEFMEGNEALQTEFRKVQAERTPPPVAVRR